MNLFQYCSLVFILVSLHHHVDAVEPDEQQVTNPLIVSLENRLASKEDRMSGPVAKNVMEALEKLYSTSQAGRGNRYVARLEELRYLLLMGKFPSEHECSLGMLKEMDKLIADEDKKGGNRKSDWKQQIGRKSTDDEQLANVAIYEKTNNNLSNYLRFHLINKGLRCNHDFEIEIDDLKKTRLIEPQLMIQLRDFVANSKECFNDRNKVPLLYYEINQQPIPHSCLIEGFANLLRSLDISLGSKNISSIKTRAQIDQVLAKLKLVGEHIRKLRQEYLDLINIVPELIDFTGHQTIGLLEASLVAEEHHIDSILELRGDIIKKLKQVNGNFFEKIFN